MKNIFILIARILMNILDKWNEHTEPAHPIHATKNGKVQSLEIPEIVNIYIHLDAIN